MSAALMTATAARPLYVVAMNPGPDEQASGATFFLDWRELPGPRMDARVVDEEREAARMAAEALASEYQPRTTVVYQLTDNTAGVMGSLLEVMRFTREVGA